MENGNEEKGQGGQNQGGNNQQGTGQLNESPVNLDLLEGLNISTKTLNAVREIGKNSAQNQQGAGDQGTGNGEGGENQNAGGENQGGQNQQNNGEGEGQGGEGEGEGDQGAGEGEEGNGEGEEDEGKEKKGAAKKPVVELKANALGLKINKNKKGDEGKTTPVVIENVEQLLSTIKSKFGQEYKDIKEVPKFFETTEKWRKDSQQLEAVVKEKDKAVNILQNLPPDIYDAVVDYYNGKDYKKVFQNAPKFDYSKDADKQDVKELVNHYFPDKFTEEDWKAETMPVGLDIAKQASIDKYKVEKEKLDTQRANVTKEADTKMAAYKTSVEGSVSRLKQSFPDLLPDTESNVKAILESGDLMSEFFNQDGTVKPEAAEMLMLAKHGKEVIVELMQAAQHLAETKTNEDILTRGADGPKTKKSKGTDKLPDEVKEQIDELNQFRQKKTF